MEDAQQQAESLYRQIKSATKESLAAALDGQPKWLLIETFGQALWNGDSEAALHVLDANVEPTACDLGGQPLVHLAADARDARVLRELMRRGARIDVVCEGESVLESAVQSGDIYTGIFNIPPGDWTVTVSLRGGDCIGDEDFVEREDEAVTVWVELSCK